MPQDGAKETEVRRHLQANLSAAWVPGMVTACEALPMNTAGKLDRRAMLVRAWEVFETQGTINDAGPARVGHQDCEVEIGLAPAVLQSWQQALGYPPANLDQSFFAAGGNSLMLINLLACIRGLTGCHLPVAEDLWGSHAEGARRAIGQDGTAGFTQDYCLRQRGQLCAALAVPAWIGTDRAKSDEYDVGSAAGSELLYVAASRRRHRGAAAQFF